MITEIRGFISIPFLSALTLCKRLDSLGPLHLQLKDPLNGGGRANLPEPNLFQTTNSVVPRPPEVNETAVRGEAREDRCLGSGTMRRQPTGIPKLELRLDSGGSGKRSA